jgi:hypothetical protein
MDSALTIDTVAIEQHQDGLYRLATLPVWAGLKPFATWK